MIASLAAANGMVFIPPDADLAEGAEVVAWELRPRDAS
jgi:molybdopterin biosynthesis enzyme